MYKIGQYVCINDAEEHMRVGKVTQVFRGVATVSSSLFYVVDILSALCPRICREEELSEYTLKEGDRRIVHGLGEVRVVSYGTTRAGTGIVTVECLENGFIETKPFWEVISAPPVRN